MANPQITVRGPIEAEFAELRNQAEKDYITARHAAETTYRNTLTTIETNRRAALEEAGFNENGSTPPTYDTVVPENTVLPVITGLAETGETLTCSNGTWNQADTFSFQWQNAGVNISGATTNTYVLQATDEGDLITCEVTAANETGTTKVETAGVTPTAP